MKKEKLKVPVFVGKVNTFRKAAKLLQEHGIKSRHSSPKQSDGVLRVAAKDAETARSILPQLGEGTLSAQDALYFNCYKCGADLAVGANHCPQCGEFVGDPHAM